MVIKSIFQIIAIAAILLSVDVNAQNIAESNWKGKCIENKQTDLNAVDTFSSSLELTIQINTIKNGKESTAIDFRHSERIRKESSLIEIDENHAIKISIARVVDYGLKKYIYKLTFFEKDECWREMSLFTQWAEFSPGVISTGHSVGSTGSEDFYGFEGQIRIK
ncbi:hypothetical protein [Halocola ammonii]